MNFVEKYFGRLGNSLFQYAYIYAQFRDGIIPNVYLQDPKYFDKYRNEIKQMFGEGISIDNRIAIHVRRGDYVNNPFYVDLIKTNYYGDAASKFPNERFLIFSDDINWCKEYFEHWNSDFSSEKSEEEDLKLMASCKGIIMANSSFSWWAAYLSDAEKIIYPKQWYSDGVQRTVCPKEWTGI